MKKYLPNSRKIAVLIGNICEHYDSALFGLLTPFLAPVFFPQKDPVTALIMTYLLIPIGMIARPFGALFFGWIGDNWGRKKALSISLFGMAIMSLLIGLLPTYQQIGFLAPVLLTAGRILQNFFSSGESIGGAIFLIENSEEKKKDFLSSLFNASTIVGILIASLCVSILSKAGIIQVNWRWLYFLGAGTAYVGYFLRRKCDFQETGLNSKEKFSLKKVGLNIWNNRLAFVTIVCGSGLMYANYMIALVMMNGFIPLVSTYTKEQMIHLNTGLLLLDCLIMPLFGLLATKYPRHRLMLIAALSTALSAMPLFHILQGASLMMVIAIRLTLVLFGVWFSATFHSWAQGLIPKENRYSLISLGYALGSQLLGGPTAAVSLGLYKKTHVASSTAFYLIFLALLASSMIFISTRKKSKELLA